MKAVGTIYKIAAGAVVGTAAPSFEQLINGLVYELFFPDDLHQANIRLFDSAAKAGLDRLTTLHGSSLADAAHEIATVIFAPSHPIQGMLADLQRLGVVRVIEGRD